MNEPSAPTSFVRLRWAGVSHSQVVPPYAMLEEPHRLVLVVEGQPLLVRGCACEACEATMGGSVEPLSLAEAVAVLTRREQAAGPVEHVTLCFDDHMTKPLADGSEPVAVTFAVALRDALAEVGVTCRLVVPARPEPYPLGTWLRAVGDDVQLGLDHLLGEGMLAQVVPAGWVTCTPGVSVMALAVGRKQPAGYAWDCLEPLGREPTEDELAASRQLCGRVGDLIQARHGWMGIITVGGAAMYEARVVDEIAKLVAKLPQLTAAGRATDVAGHAKRLAKLLRGFALHPRGDEAAALAQALGRDPRGDAAELQDIAAWVSAITAAAAEPEEVVS